MNNIVKTSNTATSASEHQAAIRTALKTSLYPGAKEESIDMVLSYCAAAGLDPMQKPVHIVPMYDGEKMRDVVMPGIALYRIQAARSGKFAGVSEPEFGPMVTKKLGKDEVTFPEWCRVTVRRMLENGHIAEFTALEYWIENYATKGKNYSEPNAMWSKRVRGQLAKCAQAQALRMAFPELGGMPTAEEMEGKSLDGDVTGSIPTPAPQSARLALEAYPEESFSEYLPKWRTAIENGSRTAEEIIALASTKGVLSDAQKAAILALDTTEAEFTELPESAA